MRGKASIGTMMRARTTFCRIPKRFLFSRKMKLQILSENLYVHKKKLLAWIGHYVWNYTQLRYV